MNQLKFILANCKYGQKNPGVELGSKILFNQLQRKDPFIKQKLVTTIKNSYFKDMLGYKFLYDTSKQLLTQHHKVITLGGDHSISMGSVPAFFDIFREQGTLLWIDAHPDINTPETSTTGNLHGMSVASIFNLMKPVINSNYKPSFDQLIYIGLRSIDPPEQLFLDTNNILYFDNKTIQEKGMEHVIDVIMKKTKKNIHVSFDIDSLDPSITPATGTPVENGLELLETINLIENLEEKRLVRSVDFVEYNPYMYDAEKVTVQNCMKILNLFIK